MRSSQHNTTGLYVSIPFCRSKCTYCNFASGVHPASEHARYVERVIEDLASAGEWAARIGVELPRNVDTVYLGGGTPSLLKPELLERLFATMRAEFDLEPEAEITVECAPGQIADETLEALAGAGVNRVSLGVQSFIDREARGTGRLHSRAVVEEDLRRLRGAGIANLNVDLIAGLAGQTPTSWEESLAALADCGVPHASVYMLEVDEDSRLGREMLARGTRYQAGLVPSDDAMAQMYSVAIDRLGQAGLGQYEISNFCRPGFESRHNLRYWQRRPYLGLGLDASSMLRGARQDSSDSTKNLSKNGEKDASGAKARVDSAGFMSGLKPRPTARMSIPADCSEGCVLRSTTSDELAVYLAGREPVEMTWLSPARQHEEAWFLGLRLNAGVEVAVLEREFGAAVVTPALEAVGRMVVAGLLTSDGKTVRLTRRGQLLSNDVFQEFLGLAGEEGEVAAGAPRS
jgi:oxygen-independent coproporphyrinogen-3 oxidase